jgi:hypothetical protein
MNKYEQKKIIMIGMLTIVLLGIIIPAKSIPIKETDDNRQVIKFDGYISIQVNVNENGENIVDDAANEPSLAIDPLNPDNIVAAWRQFDTIETPKPEAGCAYSHDGGERWKFIGTLENTGLFGTDPIVETDSEGNFYYLSLTEDTDETLYCDLFTSKDKGETWGEPRFVYSGDKEWMAIDKTEGIGRGNMYVNWQTLKNPYGKNTFIRSTDQGDTFSYPQEVPYFPALGTIAIGPDGEVYLSGVKAFGPLFIQNVFLVVKSEDAQNPQVQTPSFTGNVVNLGGFNRIFFNPEPNPDGLLTQVWIDVDCSNGPYRGNVYLLSAVKPFGFNLNVIRDPMDVHFVRSTDGGITWSSPIRINDDPIQSRSWQWFPAFSVAPNGRLDAVWYDSRNTDVSNQCQLFYSYSVDGGQTWSKNQAVTSIFDTHIGWPDSGNSKKIGDYICMESTDSSANIIFSATFNGEQDIYFLKIPANNLNER